MVGRGHDDGPDEDCRRCYFSQVPAINDQFFLRAVRPYCWFAAVLLFLSYIIGLWFTLRTHAATIWNIEMEDKKVHLPPGPNGSISHQPISSSQHLPGKTHSNGSSKGSGERNASTAIQETQLYRRILNQSLKERGLSIQNTETHRQAPTTSNSPHTQTPHIAPPKIGEGDNSAIADDISQRSIQISRLSDEENNNLIRQVAEMAATAAAVAARDAVRAPRKTSASAYTAAQRTPRPSGPPMAFLDDNDTATAEAPAGGGHDAPNWGRAKSAVILLGATFLYAIIAEILVNTVDVVLESVDIDEKFLGITLFALVPNTTEFLNAISFAMNGNIALSMEIGSAYALQVCLLQIPALVLFSAVHGRYVSPEDLLNHTFSLIFPQWDMVTVILCVFLLSYVYGEGKSNYFKGSILVLTYLVIIVGFYLAGYSSDVEMLGVNKYDTLALGQRVNKYNTQGLGRNGMAL